VDHLPDIETLTVWLNNYGSIALFVLLAMGIIALPVPEETLMVIAGILMSNGNLRIAPTIIAACCGSICGISVSYLIGKTAGHYLFSKYGRWFGITETRLNKAHEWFQKFGKWALFIGYFIPGVRHFTGLSAGTTKLDFQQFAIFAYTGACLWVSLFLSIGYYFGNYGLGWLENLEVGIEETIIIAVLALLVLLFFFTRKKDSSNPSS
jgi:membrane protein DedA with SNARE-associated domain